LYLNRHTEFEPQKLPFGFLGLRLWPPRILAGITILADENVEAISQIDQTAILSMGLPEGSSVYVGKINPLEFARFLAKIAYAYAVADLGKYAFIPLILPLLFGRRAVFTDLVGGDYEIPPATSDLHRLQSFVCDAGIVKFQCVQIRLFANRGTPIYHVVVGLVRKSGDSNYYKDALERQFAFKNQ
jgi:hypothetical protein